MEFVNSPTATVNGAATTAPGVGQITGWLRVLVEPGSVVELRALEVVDNPKYPSFTVSGYFDADHLERMATEARRLSPLAGGVYWTPNPVAPEMLSLAKNRVIKRPKITTCDANIVGRIWVPLDYDPARRSSVEGVKAPAKIPSTDAEKALALELRGRVRDWLTSRGVPASVFGDTGNGYLDLLKIDLPRDDNQLVELFLKAISGHFSDDRAGVDSGTFNPARVLKIPGTLSRKGEDLHGRPHRPSRLIEIPETIEVLEAKLIREIVAELTPEEEPQPEPATKPRGGRRDRQAYPDACERARKYVLSNGFPESIEGQHGHKPLYRAACECVDGFGLSRTDALSVLREYNAAKAQPGESEEQLNHKVDQAIKNHPVPSLKRLNADRNEGKDKAHEGNGKDRTRLLRNFRGSADNPKYLAAAEILEHARQMTSGWPRRTDDGLLFYPDATRDGLRPGFLAGSSQLFAFLAQHGSVIWGRGWASISREVFYEYARQSAESFASIQAYPHWPAIAGAYYLHDPVQEGGTTGALDEYLDFYTFASPVDRELGRASILTPYWGGPPGQRPAIVFTTEDQAADGGVGHGKTTFAYAPALGRTGFTPTISRTSDIDVVKARLLSAEGMRARLVILDNVKSLRLSSEDIESLVTTPIISGKRMYHGEASIPNLFGWALTVNDPALSRDMARRGVPIRMGRAAYDGTWTRRVEAFLKARRPDVLRDIRSLLLAPPARGYTTGSRWGTWELEILAKCNHPTAARDQFLAAQDDLNEDARQAETVREQFHSELAWLGSSSDLDPDQMQAEIPVPIAAEWVNRALRKAWAGNAASRALKSFRVPELTHEKGRACNVWVWRGSNYANATDKGIYMLRMGDKRQVTYTFKPGDTVEDVEHVEDESPY